MRLPNIQPSPRATVTVPRLCGGLNLWDQPEQVGDNQLTACNNVWWHDGALQTRPGLRKTVTTDGIGGTLRRQNLSERETLLMRFEGQGAGSYIFYAALITTAENDVGTAPHIELIGSRNRYFLAHSDHGVPVSMGVRAPRNAAYDWVFFMDTGAVVTYAAAEGWKQIERYRVSDGKFDPYIPLVMMNGHGHDTPGDAKAVTPEAFNLLTPQARFTFTTDGISKVYPLPMEGRPVRARLTLYDKNIDGTVTPYTVEATHFDSTDNLGVFDGLTGADLGRSDVSVVHIQVVGKQVICWGNTSEDTLLLPQAYEQGANNLELILLCDVEGYQKATIPQMSRATWFGGNKGGLDSGIHLFVTGHPEKPNLLHWSDVNNPLYFPENNYAYVGEDSSPITALAKQGELLVIFREHDLYCVQYVAGEVPTAQQLEDGEVIETTVHKSYFPITQLHPNIGCDCPDTVRLVNNKLVWLTSDGRVHILTAASQYSERNVRQASPLIEQALRSHTKAELQAALAGEYEGYYVLLVGNKLYLMDCQTAAFTSFQYYSREETAQKALPWYVWTLPPHVYTGLVYDGEGLTLVAEDGEGCSALYTFGGDSDDGEPIESSFTTKLFRFEEGNSRMSIGRLQLCVGDAAGCRISVQYVTEQGTTEDGYLLECDGAHHGALRRYPLSPHLRMVDCFGLTLTARQPMTVAGLQINYKKQGVVR